MAHLTPDRPDRVDALDMLRGVLALSVAVYHFHVVTHVFSGTVRDVVVVSGIYAVQLFFVLSGFCFFHLYAANTPTQGQWVGFYLKRYLRIAPLYYVALLASPLLTPAANPHVSTSTLLRNLSLSFGAFHPNQSMLPGGWSIGVECVFYALLPLLLWVTRTRFGLYALTLLAMGWAVPLTFSEVASAPAPQRFHVYVTLPNHAFLFLIGGVIADLRRRWSHRLQPWQALAAVGAFIAAIVWAQPAFYDHFSVIVGLPRVLYVALGTLAVAALALMRPTRSPLLRPLRVLGDLSYAVYLGHPFAWLATLHLLPTASPPLQLSLAVIATVTLATVAHHALERPAIDLSHRLAAQRQGRAQPRLPVLTKSY